MTVMAALKSLRGTSYEVLYWDASISRGRIAKLLLPNLGDKVRQRTKAPHWLPRLFQRLVEIISVMVA